MVRNGNATEPWLHRAAQIAKIRDDMADSDLTSGLRKKKRTRGVAWTDAEEKELTKQTKIFFAKGKKWAAILKNDRTGAKIFHPSRDGQKLKDKYDQVHGKGASNKLPWATMCI